MTPAFEKTIVIDNEYCSITLDSFNPVVEDKVTFSATLTDKSENTAYQFVLESAAVNTLENYPYFNVLVQPQETVQQDISFSNLEEYDMKEFTNIELTFKVYDPDKWQASPAVYETSYIYPYGKENASIYSRTSQESDLVIEENDTFTAVLTGTDSNHATGFAATFYLENNSDSPITFAFDQMVVNGIDLPSSFERTVGAHKKAYTWTFWSDDVFKEAGIDSVDDIQITLTVYEGETVYGDKLYSDIITFKP